MPVRIPNTFFPLFRSIGRIRQLPPLTPIYAQGDPAANFYLVTRGRVRAFALSSAGKEITLEVLDEGRIFGDGSFLGGTHRSVTMETVTESEVVSCRSEDLLCLCHQSEELMTLIFQHMAETCNYLTHQITRLVSYNSEQKIADFLLCESDCRGPSCPRAILPYTHEEIAHSVSLNRITVTRVLSSFKARELIDCQYGEIRILNRNALSKLLPDDRAASIR